MQLSHVKRLDKFALAGLILVVLLQVVWLFPALSQRVTLILLGITPPPTYQHAIYGGLEIIKLACLLFLSVHLILF